MIYDFEFNQREMTNQEYEDFYREQEIERAANDEHLLDMMKQRLSEEDVNGLLDLMVEDEKVNFNFSIEKKPKGERFIGSNVTSFGDHYVDQRYYSDMCDAFYGTISVPIGDGEYFQFEFNM